ncbi:MAG: hypothetical protein Q8M76_00100 [Spirochaetaceae bacterium]|nr:hypothetical protein [Spirochaetaceae bacterium]
MARGQRALRALVLALASVASPAYAQGTSPEKWIAGIARLSPESAAEEGSVLLEILPRLVLARLDALPDRLQNASEGLESVELSNLRSRFSSGSELAVKLDARAASFLDPPAKGSVEMAIEASDKLVQEARKNLTQIGASEAKPASAVSASLWKSHASGELVQIPLGGARAAAKKEDLDLLISGSLSFKEGYAIAKLTAYDAALDRESWTWRGACALDDPAPLADEMATAIERLIAGREFARVDLAPDPPSASLYAGNVKLPSGSGTAFVFAPGKTRIRAESTGYSPWSTTLDLSMGDRISLTANLSRLSTGRVTISTDPPGAAIFIDSAPAGAAPFELPLDGTRRVATAFLAGRERADAVLPASGEAALAIALPLVDGLGPGGRVGAAKDRFYEAFGWFFLSLPAATLSAGAFASYSAAAVSSGSLSSLITSRNVSATVMVASVGACAGLAANAIVRLVSYIRAVK